MWRRQTSVAVAEVSGAGELQEKTGNPMMGMRVGVYVGRASAEEVKARRMPRGEVEERKLQVQRNLGSERDVRYKFADNPT